MRALLEDSDLHRAKLWSGEYGTFEIRLTGNLVMPDIFPELVFLDPNGIDRVVTLPVVKRGRRVFIIHDGVANTLTVEESGGADIVTVSVGEMACLVSNGAQWRYFAGGNETGAAGAASIYAAITDGTNTATPVGSDTFKFRAGSLLSAVVTNNDGVHGDNLLVSLADMAGLSVPARAANSSGPLAALTAASAGDVLWRSGTSLIFGPLDLATVGLTNFLAVAKGGTGATTKTVGFDNLSPLTTKGDLIAFNGSNNIRIGVGADGQFLAAASGQASGLQWVNANAHTHVVGDITGLQEFIEDTIGASILDTSSIDFSYNDTSGRITADVLPAGVNHNALSNYVANEHINHTSVSIATSNTSGLQGGGTIAATRNLAIDWLSLTAGSGAMQGDDLLGCYDASDAAHRSRKYEEINRVVWITSVGGSANAITGTANPVVTAYRTGTLYLFTATTNNTTSVTVNWSGVGAANVKKNGQDPTADEILSGRTYGLMYDGTNMNMVFSSAGL